LRSAVVAGVETIDPVAALNAAGLACKERAKYDEGRAHYERALALVQQEPAESASRDTDEATLYHNLAGIEHALGNYAEAEPLARKSVELRTRSFGPAHRAVAADMVALAAILDGLDRYDEAEALCLDALRILERHPVLNAAEIAVAHNNLGTQYVRRGRYVAAEEHLSRAATLKEGMLGSRHPDLAVTLNNLALLQERKRDYSSAIALYAAAVDILRHALGGEHPKTIACDQNRVRCAAEAETSTSTQLHGGIMSQSNEIVRIDLSQNQKEQVKTTTGKDVEAIELTVQELEERIAPRLAANHNETLLTD
jgi:tetratricopeptide (TPR) repeat protein